MLKVRFLKDHKRGKEGAVTNMHEAMAEPLLEAGDVELIEGDYTPPVKEVLVDPNASVLANKHSTKKKASKKAAKKVTKKVESKEAE